MQDLARWEWDEAMGRAEVSRKGEGIPWELPRGRDGIFHILQHCIYLGSEQGSEVFGELN